MSLKTAESWFVTDRLPEGQISFASEEGRTVFFEASSAGYLTCYFKLAQQLLTSFEPTYGCGLATLTMVLNTLNADPGRVWKDIYRWYKETMLEHCTPYNIIEKNGIVFQQFACMAECNHLHVKRMCLANYSASVDDFRSTCKLVTSGDCEEVLVVCYARAGLEQIGPGHFCPIGGYHPGRDLVLIFENARYKYPLHWVPVENLWKAMSTIDPVTGCPRGYFILRRQQEHNKPNLLFKIVSPLDNNIPHQRWLTFLHTVLLPWYDVIKGLGTNGTAPTFSIANVVNVFLEILMKEKCSGISHLQGVHIQLGVDSSLGKECALCRLREEIESSSIYAVARDQIKGKCIQYEMCECWEKLVSQVVDGQKPQEIKCCQITYQPSACHLRQFTLVHFTVIVLLSWPYEVNNNTGASEVYNNMKSIAAKQLSNSHRYLKEEVENITKRFLGAIW